MTTFNDCTSWNNLKYIYFEFVFLYQVMAYNLCFFLPNLYHPIFYVMTHFKSHSFALLFLSYIIHSYTYFVSYFCVINSVTYFLSNVINSVTYFLCNVINSVTYFLCNTLFHVIYLL